MKQRDALAGLTTFIAVAKAGSLTQAAAQLGVSVAAVSLAIQQLEQDVKTRLFIRTTRQIRLTEAGEHYLAHIQPAVAQLQAARETLLDQDTTPRGLIRLTAPRITHRWLVLPLLKALAQRAPEVVVEVEYNDAFVDIVAEGFDAGIRLASGVDLDMIGVPLATQLRSVLVGSPDYFQQRGIPHTVADLSQHDCIFLRYGAYQQLDTWQFVQEATHLAPALPARWIVSDIEASIQLALAGMGLSYVLARALVADDLAAGRLVSVLDHWVEPIPDILLYYPNRQLPPKMQALLAAIRAIK